MTHNPIADAKATKVAIALNVLGVTIAIWFAFYPRPYLWSAIVAMLFPLVYLAVVVVYQGLIRFSTSCLAFVICCIVLMIKGYDVELVEYRDAGLYVSVLSAFILLFLILLSVEFQIKTKQGRTNILASILFVFFYSFGVVVLSNCLFDQSKPQIVKTTISAVKVTDGTKSQTYHLYLAPWGPKQNMDHVTVTESQYSAAHPGDTVQIQLRPGFLNIRWYSVTLP
jgi:hypothetical protein